MNVSTPNALNASPDGLLEVAAQWRPHAAPELIIRLDRPPASRLLIGRTPVAASALAPRLFAICGRAQGLAARLALAAAQGEASAVSCAQEARQEALREHLWHLLLAWPAALGKVGELDLYKHCLYLLQEGQNFVTAELRRSADTLLETLATLPDVAPLSFSLLPPPTDAPATIPANVLSGPLARQPDALSLPPVVAALSARVHELTAPGYLGYCAARTLAAGVGIAWVETARGRLIHRVRLVDGRVADYEILAPTDINFAPRGPLRQWLNGCAGMNAATVRGVIERAVLALDPCVRLAIDYQEQ